MGDGRPHLGSALVVVGGAGLIAYLSHGTLFYVCIVLVVIGLALFIPWRRPARISSELHIIRATYGGKKHKNVTRRVRRLIGNGQLPFVVNNSTMGGDPDQNEAKDLAIVYRHTVVDRKIVPENATVDLPQ